MATTSTTNSVVSDNASASAARPTIASRVLWLGLAIALLAISWRFAEVDPWILLRPATLAAIWKFLTGLFPPDVSLSFLATVLRATIQTIATAVAGTVLSVTLALPLGILATATLWNRGILISAELGSVPYRTGAAASRLSRAPLGFLRAAPDLVWALLFVATVGLGPLAGTLAFTVSYTGMLGCLYADVFEHVDPQPLRRYSRPEPHACRSFCAECGHKLCPTWWPIRCIRSSVVCARRRCWDLWVPAASVMKLASR
jgi:phosphonate transport system permease protein